MGLGQIMTLANSIIGVSVLAMPFCFKQCGIILSILVLFLSSIMTRLACHFLLKAAVLARRRNYEFLAFHAFGPKGKLMVELCIIGFLFGTCIAFFVVMGDLGPAIISEMLDVNKSPSIRSSVLIGLALLVVLPLGLLRNVDSLSSLCTATILFYFFLVLKIMSEATTHLLAGDWLQYVHLWRPAGILQCIPIFAMALSCQTQVFEIYESLPDPSLPKMNEVVRAAVNICTGVYVCMGFFGYVAVCGPSTSILGEKSLPPPPLTGNILMSFPSSFSMQAIKLFFVASIACSFPLVIFPCRASLHSLLFRRVPHHESGVSGSGAGGGSASTVSLLPPGSSGTQALERIPERRFRLLTILLVAGSLAIAFALPDIELVLGLVGSSIGTITCLLLPALCFLKVAPSHPYHHSRYGGGKGVTAERLLAQVMIVLGTSILILSTYANLHAVDQAHTEEAVTQRSLHEIPKIPAPIIPAEVGGGGKPAIPIVIQPVVQNIEAPKIDIPAKLSDNFDMKSKKDPDAIKAVNSESEKRQEPPIPVAPDKKVKKKQQPEEDDKLKPENERKGEEANANPIEKPLGDNLGKIDDSVKEPLEAHDTVHGDAIKKEEEEVGIEEGAAKKERERLEEEEKKEKERKEKELLKKLADDRKKQQELIDVQMEILKKLEALGSKKSDNEVLPKEKGSKLVENKADLSEAYKVDSKSPFAPKKETLKIEKSPAEPIRGKDNVDQRSNTGPKEFLPYAPAMNSNREAETKSKPYAQKNGIINKTIHEQVNIKRSEIKEKHVSKGKNISSTVVDGKAANLSTNDLKQMKAAVPMPLLLVGNQQSKGMEKSVDREKREVSLDEKFDQIFSELINNGSAQQHVAQVVDSPELSPQVRDDKIANTSESLVLKAVEEIPPSKESEKTPTIIPVLKAKDDPGAFPVAQNILPSKQTLFSDDTKEINEKLSVNDKSIALMPCPTILREKENFASPTLQIPVRLSDPVDNKLSRGRIDCGFNVDDVAMGSMPLKRDLKFVDEEKDETKVKSRG